MSLARPQPPHGDLFRGMREFVERAVPVLEFVNRGWGTTEITDDLVTRSEEALAILERLREEE